MVSQALGVVLTPFVYKKSVRHFVWTKNRKSWTKHSKNRSDFLSVQNIGPMICIYKKIGPIFFIIDKKSDRSFVYKRCENNLKSVKFPVIAHRVCAFVMKECKLFLIDYENTILKYQKYNFWRQFRLNQF